MKKMKSLLAGVISAAILCSCGNKSNTSSYVIPETILLPESIIEEFNMTAAEDVTLIPVKTDILLKDIGPTECYGDYLFMVSSDRATLYEIYKDSVIGVLDRQGRGPGEYEVISSLAYSVEDSLLYISSNRGSIYMQVYKGNNFIYQGKLMLDEDGTSQVSSFCLLDSKRMMISKLEQSGLRSSFLGEKSEKDNEVSFGGKFIIDTKTGAIIDTVLMYDVYDFCWELANASQSDYCRHDGGISFPRTGFNFVTIYNYSKEGVLTQGPSFRYDDMFAIPDKYMITDLEKNNGEQLGKYLTWVYPFSTHDQRKSMGATSLNVKGDSICFWNTVCGTDGENWSVYNYNVYDGKNVYRYCYKIDNMNWRVLPQFVYNGRYGELWQGFPSMLNDEEDYSPLQKKIADMYDSQEDNPVIFLYNSL